MAVGGIERGKSVDPRLILPADARVIPMAGDRLSGAAGKAGVRMVSL